MAFDDNGDRIYAGYDVINIREHQKQHVVGKFSYDSVSIHEGYDRKSRITRGYFSILFGATVKCCVILD